MIGTRQAEPLYLESPSGDFYTSPFLLALATIPPKLPPSEKGLIGEKSSSCHLIGARWYDPDLGMWMSPDPAGEFANPYSYVGGNAPNLSDPNGLCSSDDPSDCPAVPEKEACAKDGKQVPCNESGDPVSTAVGVGATVAVAVLTDIFGGSLGGGGRTPGNLGDLVCVENCPDEGDKKTSAPTSAPSQPVQAIYSFTSSNSNTTISFPGLNRYEYYINRAHSEYETSTHWENGERMVDDIPTFLHGMLDEWHGVYYGGDGVKGNTAYGVMPDYIEVPGGATELTGQSSNILYSSEKNIQKFFTKAGHGESFGLKGNWNPGRIDEARAAIGKHINDPGIKVIPGRFLGQNVIHYLNPSNGLNIMSKLNGEFIQGYKLGPEQLRALLATGRLY